MRHQPLRRALGFDLLRSLAEGERLGLGENVGGQQIVMASERVQRAAEGDEVGRNQLGSLMNQLVEGMLSVGAGLAPENRPGLIIDLPPVERHVLAVGFHRELLQVGRKSLQILIVGKYAYSLGAEEVVVPDR